MDILVGNYYANDHKEDGVIDTNIILILPKKEDTPQFQTRTETMWIRNGEVKQIYANNWISDFFKREATAEEIALFKEHRSRIDELPNYSDAILEDISE
ncbi:hypothetical protein [Bacillus sp. Brlt_9]|uniref:hypothetical protein n=1 Tax=Bacillus sp. Brlt_9 TaxID=3110916 RepID=UPI003F7C789F